MITPEDQIKVKQLTEEYWSREVKSSEFKAIFAGKEIGHRIADYVDERTVVMLESSFNTKHELDAKKVKRARSMGDVWLGSGGIYNPINVKAGEAGKNGQPNMVSLTKLLDSLMGRRIDSYYLLIVKMRLEDVPASVEVSERELVPSKIVPNVYFVDMLDYLDYVTFDSGPGQTMLKEKQFYEAMDVGVAPRSLSMGQKVSALIDLLEDGDRRLIENRRNKMVRLRNDFQRYAQTDGHVVGQSGLHLG